MRSDTRADASGAKLAITGPVGMPIRFDHQTQSFSIGHQVIEDGHIATVYTPVGHMAGDPEAILAPITEGAAELPAAVLMAGPAASRGL